MVVWGVGEEGRVDVYICRYVCCGYVCCGYVCCGYVCICVIICILEGTFLTVYEAEFTVVQTVIV